MNLPALHRSPGALAAPVLLAFCAVLTSRQSGILPGESSVPMDVTRALPSCGSCHSRQPNQNGRIQVRIGTGVLSVTAGASLTATLQVTGGPGSGFGFCLESDRGAFLAGTGTRVGTAGNRVITHSMRGSGTWSLSFQAPAAPGIVLWHAVGQSVNGDGRTDGDSFGFHGPDSAVPGTAYRLFVNGSGVQGVGTGCAGTGGHAPIAGAISPAVRGQTFEVQVHNVAPGALLLCGLGYSLTSWAGIPLPLDLSIAGAPGCSLYTNLILLQAAAAAGAGSGGGAASVRWPIPADPFLAGASVVAQALVVDPAANALGLTTSNAVRSTVQ